MRVAIAILLLALAGCVDLSPQLRWQHADELAGKAGWHKLRLPAGEFVLTAYVPETLVRAGTLTVYVEGDGFAWVSRTQPSGDPTPRKPVGLELALRHPQGAAVYLARPCQYVQPEDAQGCRQAYWTDRRFAPEVIDASNRAIDELKRRYGASKLVLVGYSGGGAVAALVATRRNDVAQLVTVAGNLDTRAWTTMLRVPALEGSLNPADEWRALTNVPQLHFVGGRDEVVGPTVAAAYAAHFPPERQPRIVTIPGFDHVCCWTEKWGDLLKRYD